MGFGPSRNSRRDEVFDAQFHIIKMICNMPSLIASDYQLTSNFWMNVLSITYYMDWLRAQKKLSFPSLIEKYFYLIDLLVSEVKGYV